MNRSSEMQAVEGASGAPEAKQIEEFRVTIYDYYRSHGRKMPWRETSDAYHILVSEIMLQQTQVSRVVEKYPEFIAEFPNILALNDAPLQKVLAAWQGLGYNRRALALKAVAKQVVEVFGGRIPRSMTDLMLLKGIGASTAGAIAAFAFNDPAVFIETNIRTVFIHFFFPEKASVRDTEVLQIIEAALDRENPRTWYWALMDYGAMLKKNGLCMNAKSAHHQKQSPFHGSVRELRGRILKLLVDAPGITPMEVARETGFGIEKVRDGFERLETEGFIVSEAGRYRISG
jgi:A/G-specific adenine glycosylase